MVRKENYKQKYYGPVIDSRELWMRANNELQQLYREHGKLGEIKVPKEGGQIASKDGRIKNA